MSNLPYKCDLSWADCVITLLKKQKIEIFQFQALTESRQNIIETLDCWKALLVNSSSWREIMEHMKKNIRNHAERNAELRARLENMKSEVFAQVKNVLSIDAEISAYLTEALDEFDEDNGGQLGVWEFQQALLFLGLNRN